MQRLFATLCLLLGLLLLTNTAGADDLQDIKQILQRIEQKTDRIDARLTVVEQRVTVLENRGLPPNPAMAQNGNGNGNGNGFGYDRPPVPPPQDARVINNIYVNGNPVMREAQQTIQRGSGPMYYCPRCGRYWHYCHCGCGGYRYYEPRAHAWQWIRGPYG